MLVSFTLVFLFPVTSTSQFQSAVHPPVPPSFLPIIWVTQSIFLFLTVYQSLRFSHIHSVLGFYLVVIIDIIFLEIFMRWNTNLEFMENEETTKCRGNWNMQNINFQSHLLIYIHLFLEYQDGLCSHRIAHVTTWFF